jgi:serine/threonine protein kinase/tetratricopeptide (TPR) repeat protein
VTTLDARHYDLAQALADRYLLERPIGRGGMATVFLAQDRKHRRPVAIKVLHPELAVMLGSQRFLREIEIAARLSHPHILALHDSGEAGSYLYYVMPYVEGESLRQRLEARHRLEPDEALHILRNVGSALDYAHSRGVIHRDIKPENILLTEGFAVVADFGIAKALDAAGTASLTQTGLGIGSPMYMSPEQAVGEKDLDGRTDVYSLACVFYEMLVGRPPFEGRTTAHLVSQHAMEPVPRINAELPDASPLFDAIIRKAMAKDPDHRFATVKEMLDSLDPSRQAFTVSASTSPGTQKPPVSIAVLPFVDLSPNRDQEYLCDGIAEEVMDALAKAGGIKVASRGSSFVYRGRDVDPRIIGKDLKVGTVLDGSLQRSGDRLRVTARLSSTEDGFQLWTERFSREITDVFALQDEIASAIVGALKIRISSAERLVKKRHTGNLDAYQLYLKGRYHWNRRFQGGFQKAMECFRGAIQLDPLYPQPYVGLADAFNSLASYDYMSPREAYPRAFDGARRALALDPDLAEAHTSLAWATAQCNRDWEAALEEFHIAERLNPEYGVTQSWHALVLAQLGRLDEAAERMRRGISLEPLDMPINAGLGWVYCYQRRFEESVAQLTTAMTIDPDYQAAKAFLGMTLVCMGRYDQAVEYLNQARGIPGAAGLIGLALARLGQPDKAREMLAEMERGTVINPHSMAIVHMGLGETDQAFEWLERGISEFTMMLNFAAVNPVLDPLRGDPRFTELLRKLKLDPVQRS